MTSARLRRVSLVAAAYSCLSLGLTFGCANSPAGSNVAALDGSGAVAAPANPCRTAQVANILGQQSDYVIMNETSGCITAIFEIDEAGYKGRMIAQNIELAPSGRAYFTAELGAFGVEITRADGSKVEISSLASGIINQNGALARGAVWNGEQQDYYGNGQLENRPWTMIRTYNANLSAQTRDAVTAANTFFVSGAGGGGGGGGSNAGRATAVLNDGSRYSQDVGGQYPQAQQGQYPQAQQGQYPQAQQGQYAQAQQAQTGGSCGGGGGF